MTAAKVKGAGVPAPAPMALFYAGAGIAVFPVNERKEPLTGKGGFHHATTEREQIEAWWKRWPTAGIATPAFDVVDVDTYKPACRETWRRIKPLVGNGAHSRTPRGGLQYFYAPGTLRRAKIGPGVDNRYAGANYVLLPPSRFVWEDGEGRYEWIVPLPGRNPKPAPDFPVDANGGGTASEMVRKIRTREPIDDDRNTSAFWHAVELIEQNPELSQAAIEARTQAFVDSRCGGNLDEVDVAKQVRGAFTFVARKAPQRGARAAGSLVAGKSENGEVDWLAANELKQVEWVDRPLLQAAFTLLAGRPGIGKGALVAYWAARCTNGDLYGEPRTVILLSSEDDVEIDLGPRIEAAGGNRDLVALVPHTFRLPDDIEWLRNYVGQAGQRAPVGLIAIDPLSNHTGRANTDSEAEVRVALNPLAGLAAELSLLTIGVRHLTTKEAKAGVLAAILGSTAWVGVPRVVLAAVPDCEDRTVVHIRAIKGNRVAYVDSGRRFRLNSHMLPGFTESVVRADPDGVSDVDIDELLAGKKGESASAQARDLLLGTLRDVGGRMESDRLDATVAEATGLEAKTVKNQRIELTRKGSLRAKPDKDEQGTILRWWVELTNAAPPPPDPLARAYPQSRDLDHLSGSGRESGSPDPDIPPTRESRDQGEKSASGFCPRHHSHFCPCAAPHRYRDNPEAAARWES